MPNTTAAPLDAGNENPLYRQLIARLTEDIASGRYPAGERIPSEQSLCEMYGVSRVTVRKAVLALSSEGVLLRRQGKGTFVQQKRLQRDLSSVTSFSDACAQLSRTANARVLSAGMSRATEDDCAALRLEAGSQVVAVTRLRLADDLPVVYECNRFTPDCAFLLDEELTGSLYALLRARGRVPAHAVHDISLVYASLNVARALDVDEGEALLMLHETVFDRAGAPLHLSRQWIRGDRFTFRI